MCNLKCITGEKRQDETGRKKQKCECMEINVLNKRGRGEGSQAGVLPSLLFQRDERGERGEIMYEIGKVKAGREGEEKMRREREESVSR